MTTPLGDVLADRIAAAGPMPFEEFMRACLYDPDHGYFATGRLRSVRSGDFLTSPEVSPWFGTTLARVGAAEADREPGGPLVVVDVGAGSGSLLRPLIDELHRLDVAFTPHAVEVSPAARAALASLRGVAVHDDVEHVPLETGAPVIVVANELLDNLPAALAVRRGDGWEERHVGLVDGELALVAAGARPEVVAWADRFGGPVPDGGIVEVQREAVRWVERVLGRIDRGVLLVFDYGDTAEGLAPRRVEGTVRTYRGHHLGPDPLLEPGATDLTMDVNFTAAAATAEAAGATVELVRQAEFLERWGLGDEIDRLATDERALAAGGDAVGRLQVRAERIDASTLLHPRGLGDFRVMVARRGRQGALRPRRGRASTPGDGR